MISVKAKENSIDDNEEIGVWKIPDGMFLQARGGIVFEKGWNNVWLVFCCER
jgi:hypothetical protein